MGLFDSIAGIFGSTQQARAAKEAQRILVEAQNKAYDYSTQVSQQFAPFLSDARSQIGTSFDIIQRLIGTAEAGATTGGLTAADQITMQDAQRLMNENMASTGNLRSGASAFANEELARRATADAADRRLNYLQLAFTGAGSLSQTAGLSGQLGLGGANLAAGVFNTATNLATGRAQAELGKGAALANQITSVGGALDSGLNMGAGAFMGYNGMIPGMASTGTTSGTLAGAAMGGSNLMQLNMLQSMFGGVSNTSGSGYKSDSSSLYNYFG